MFNINVKDLFRKVSKVVKAASELYNAGRDLYVELRRGVNEVKSAWAGFRTA